MLVDTTMINYYFYNNELIFLFWLILVMIEIYK